MTIAFTCPNCLTDLRLQDRHAGECVKCPRCHGLMVVPDVDESATGDDMAPAASQQSAAAQPPFDDWQAHLRPTRGAATETPGQKPRQPETTPEGRVKFFCGSCGTKMSAAIASAGRLVTCPSCHTQQRIPAGQQRYADTASARLDQTPPHSLDRRALGGSSDSLIDALDNVDLAEARAPAASPFLTGQTNVASRRNRPPHWLLTWSTALVAAGTLLGLLLVWVAMSAPALYRDHVRPYFDKHLAPAIGGDRGREMMRLAEELIEETEKLTQTLRQVHDVESARAQMPAYIELLLHATDLEQKFTELHDQAAGALLPQTFAGLSERMRQKAAELKQESMRCGTIPGVPAIIANALAEVLTRDRTGKLGEALKKTADGRALLAAVEQSKQLGPQNAPPAPVAPPQPVAPVEQHGAAPVPRASDISSAPSALPQALPPQEPAATLSGEAGNTPENRASHDSRAFQHVALLNHLASLQSQLLDRSRLIVDAESLQKKGSSWTTMARMWQGREAEVQNLAGQEFVGEQANRYLQAKETTDRQRAQLAAEFNRLDKLGLLAKLNAQLVKHGGTAVGSGSMATDGENGVRKPSKRASPRALKRVTPQ
ncbi:MAG TPA: zf-TFIIB domain-containing protein [Pirellulales bacterium]|nr:zf-TFIIB domain-containing protein [Pirellulales bacterium]